MIRNLTILIAAFAFSTSSFAASSGTLTLKGVVGVVNDIVVNPNGDNLLLNILGGENAKQIATATESSNNLAGYKVLISSPTAGELRHTVDATKKTTYQISYDGASAVTPTVAGAVVKNVSSLAGLVSHTSVIKTNVAAYATAPAGTYQDVLTITIQAN